MKGTMSYFSGVGIHSSLQHSFSSDEAVVQLRQEFEDQGAVKQQLEEASRSTLPSLPSGRILPDSVALHPGKVVSAAAAACLTACTRDMAAQLADLLHSKMPQSRVVYCTCGQADQPSKRVNSPGSSSVKQQWSLSHTHILVYAGSSPSAVPLIVEPNFRSHFELPRASRDYTAFLSSLPELLVVDTEQMQPLVAAVSKCVAHEFKRMDLHLPPWRTTPALQSRWKTDMVTKEHVFPSGTLSCMASQRSSSSSSSSSSFDCNAPSTDVLHSSSAISASATSGALTCNTPLVVVQGFHLPGAELYIAAPAAKQTSTLARSAAGVSNSFPAPSTGSISMSIQHRHSSSKTLGGVRLALQITATGPPFTNIPACCSQSFSQGCVKGSVGGTGFCAECGHSKVPTVHKVKMMGWAAAAPSGRVQAQGLQQLY